MEADDLSLHLLPEMSCSKKLGMARERALLTEFKLWTEQTATGCRELSARTSHRQNWSSRRLALFATQILISEYMWTLPLVSLPEGCNFAEGQAALLERLRIGHPCHSGIKDACR